MEKTKHIKLTPYSPVPADSVFSVQNETPEFKSILTFVRFNKNRTVR